MGITDEDIKHGTDSTSSQTQEERSSSDQRHWQRPLGISVTTGETTLYCCYNLIDFTNETANTIFTMFPMVFIFV